MWTATCPLLGALQAFVELILHCYAAGLTVDDIQLEASTIAFSSDGAVMQPIETEMLASWAAAAYVAASSLEVDPARLREAMGMKGSGGGMKEYAAMAGEGKSGGMKDWTAMAGEWERWRDEGVSGNGRPTNFFFLLLPLPPPPFPSLSSHSSLPLFICSLLPFPTPHRRPCCRSGPHR